MEPHFIQGQAGALFALFYQPTNQVAKKVIIHIPAFAEEMNKSRRMVALQAQMLAERGSAVLILDLFGTGDSAGDYGDATWAIWLQDIHSAIQWLKERGFERFDLWGLRTGALLAMDFVNGGQQNIEQLICWQPILNSDVFVTQFLRLRIAAAIMNPNSPQEKTSDLKQQLIEGKHIEVAGYLLNPELIVPMLNLRPSQFDFSQLTQLIVLEISPSSEAEISMSTAKFIETLAVKNVQVSAKTVIGIPFWTTQEISLAPELLTETQNYFF